MNNKSGEAPSATVLPYITVARFARKAPEYDVHDDHDKDIHFTFAHCCDYNDPRFWTFLRISTIQKMAWNKKYKNKLISVHETFSISYF